jgi:cephalosporin hydroxylase
MSGSVTAPPGRSRSSLFWWKILAFALLLLAGGEFLLAAHYRHQWAYEDTASLSRRFEGVYYDSEVWKKTSWLGITSEQTPNDNWTMQEVIAETRPDYIIETGTFHGGTTLYYAAVLAQVNPSGKVITVDIEPHVEEASKFPLWRERVELITGSSVDPGMTDHIAQEVSGKNVLVTLDSLHTKAHVLKEMEIYSKLVTPGSYLVVQDTNINGNPVLPGFGPGPKEAVEEFLKTHDNFVVDRSREKLLTLYPGGWLKRVR